MTSGCSPGPSVSASRLAGASTRALLVRYGRDRDTGADDRVIPHIDPFDREDAKAYRFGLVRKVGNAVIAALLRAGLAPRVYVLLTTRGHRTGQPRTTPIRLLTYDGREWLVAPYGEVAWVLNARAAGKVLLRRGRHTSALDVVECEAGESAPVLREYVRKEPLTRPYFDAKPSDPVSGFVAEAGSHPVFRLTSPPNPS